ncbi:MAG TPA: Ig-like domain-containing protein, partial [Thermoanaerobaculia bacterium]|nr:Ig-like domain-containing protein [Thermoanaerobaculia bacterium]
TSVLANDIDRDTVPVPDTLTPILLATTTQGMLTFRADGTFDYVKTCGGSCALDHDTFTYKVNDGHVDSNVATVTIRYNSPPVAGNDSYTINEDATLTLSAPGLRANDSDIDGDITNVIVVSQPSVGTLSPIMTTALGDELPLDGSFTFVPPPDHNGPVTFTYKLRDAGGLESAVATVTINVLSVNDAPAFTLPAMPNLTACSPAGIYIPGYATGITAGAASESGQHLTFILTVDDPSLFENTGTPICVGGSGPNDPIYCTNNQLPHIDPFSGDLFFSVASGASGSTGVHVHLHDDGGTANGGIPDSPVQDFTLTVSAPNNAPSFTPGPQFVSATDIAGPQSIPWATDINANDAGQSVTFLLDLQSNASLFAPGGAPAISPTGVLTFTPAVGTQGTALVFVTLQDDGGNTCGTNQSGTQNLFVTIGPQNHAPTFTLLQDPVNAAAGLSFSDLHNFVNITGPGAGDTGQTPYTATITQLTISNPAMFQVAPLLGQESPTTFFLRFLPSSTPITGTATYRVTVKDAGGTAFGGTDTATRDFTINLGNPNHAPLFNTSTGLSTPANAAPQTFPNFVTLVSPGPGDPDQSPYTGTLTQTS